MFYKHTYLWSFSLQLEDFQNQMIESPGYPNSYPNNAYETWILTAPNASIISIKFHYFHVRTDVEYKNRAKFKIILFSFTDS